MEQIDFIRLEDHRAAARRLLSESVYRVGLTEVAHKLEEDPSTITHQLRRDGNKRPSADLEQLCFLLDPEYRKGLAALCGELLSHPPDLTPEDALREAIARSSKGYLDKAELAALYARTKRGAP